MSTAALSIADIKTRLRLLNTLLDADLVAQERERVAAERRADLLIDPR